MVTGDRVGRGKPHPEPYLRATAELGVDPRRCVAIEDSPTGAASAQAAGCHVVAVPHAVEVPSGRGRTLVGSLEQVDLDLLGTVVESGVVGSGVVRSGVVGSGVVGSGVVGSGVG